MTIYEETLRVRYAETGVRGLIKPVSTFNYFQDIMSRHCGQMKASAHDLRQNGFAWVVIRYHINIRHYPGWNDRIIIRTWRQPVKNLYELRQFEICDDTGNCLISARSTWIVINLNTKKPARLNRSLPETMINGLSHPVVLDTADTASVPEITRPDKQRYFNIRMHDLDFNTHVNNAVYIIWALETVPEAVITEMRPQEMMIQYIGESLYGDRIQSEVEYAGTADAPAFIHRMTSENTGKEITRLKTRWRCF